MNAVTRWYAGFRRIALLGGAIAMSMFFAVPGAMTSAEARTYEGNWEGHVYVPPKASAKRGLARAAKRSGYAQAKPKKGKRYAAVNRGTSDAQPYSKSVTGGGVRWVANSGCLNGQLRSVIHSVAANFGPVTVSSTCRSPSRNRAAGGARKSYHLSGNAADFRVRGNVGAVHAYLRSSGSVGGLKHYGGGLFHIDTGPRRAF